MLVNYLLLCAAYISQALPSTAPTNEGLRWETNLETAQQLARRSNRLVLVHFGGPWCEPCRRLEKQVFNQPGFGRDLQADYVAVKVDPREHRDLASRFGVKAVPTDVVITASGQLVSKIESPATPLAYSETLNRVAASVRPLTDVVTGTRPATVAVASPAARDRAPPAADSSRDRYADYYRSRRPAGRASQPADQSLTRADERVAPAAPQTTAAPVRQLAGAGDLNDPQNQGVASAARSEANSQAAGPASAVAAMKADEAIAASNQGNPSPQALSKTPPAALPLALDGYCPVTLVDQRQWHAGDRNWGALHRGRTYLFANEEAQKKFLADPDRYSPVLSGNDPVMRLDHNQDVPGKRQYGAFYNNRIYLFTSEDTFQRFDRDPNRYTIETSRQALRR